MPAAWLVVSLHGSQLYKVVVNPDPGTVELWRRRYAETYEGEPSLVLELETADGERSVLPCGRDSQSPVQGNAD